MHGSGFSKIVVGWETGGPGRDALALALLIRAASHAELVVAAVPANDLDSATGLADAAARLPYGSDARLLRLEPGDPARRLQELATAEQADLIVLGQADPREMQFLVQHGVTPVAVAPAGFASDPDTGVRVLGVAFDGSDESVVALGLAEALALEAGATLRIISVLEPMTIPAPGLSAFYGYAEPEAVAVDRLYRLLEDAAGSVDPAVRPQTIVARGRTADEIAKHAGVLDLLMIGSRGYGWLRRFLLGSTSTAVVQAAPCPVLVVPHAAVGHPADEPTAIAA